MKYFSSVRSAFQSLEERIHHLTWKQVVMGLLCLLLFFAPTLCAIAYVYHMDTRDHSEAFSVTLYDSENRQLVAEEGDPTLALSHSLLGIFHDILTSKEPLTEPYGDPESDPFIRAHMVLNGVETDLNCYFSLQENEGYCSDGNGSFYTLSDTASQYFLETAYAQVFYTSAIAPELLTIDGDVILPTTVSWYYQNTNGDFPQSNDLPTSPEIRQYEITGEIGIRFSSEPDFCVVRVYHKDKTVFEGSLAELPYLTISSGSDLHVTVRAKWNQSEGRDCYGDLTYDFQVQIRNRSSFTLSADTVTPGGFLILSCTNISNPSRILFESELDGLSPVFHQDGDEYRAILAFPKDTEPGEFPIRVSYGASYEEFLVTVEPGAAANPFFYPLLDLSDNPALSERAKDEWNGLLSAISQKEDTPIYFRGNFLNPAENGMTVGYTHGSEVFFGEELLDSFEAVGTEFLTDRSGGAPVSVWNNGRVIYTGSCELLGNFVVVDHGCGLRTWYGHLSDFNVETGDVLRKGESVGKTGTGGLATGDGYVVFCTVYDTVIDPTALMGKAFAPS